MVAPVRRTICEVTPRRTWLFVLLFWVLLTVVYLTQVVLIPRPPSEPAFPWIALAWQAVYYLGWAPATIVIWRVTRGWEIDRVGLAGFLWRHALLACATSAIHAFSVVIVSSVLIGLPVRGESYLHITWMYLRPRLHTQLLIYAAVVGAGQALGFYSQYRERQLAAARLEAQLADARLETLRAQLQPHFLFNSLHSIASLARAGDTAGVVRLISGFSDLLRHLLDTSTTHLSVREELALVGQYLDLQRVRFGDRLSVRIKSTPEADAARVPLLVVQPLVENALRHGLSSRVEAGSISISARRIGDALVVEVGDDGVGLPAEWSPETTPGTGLRNLRSRLAAEFGPRGTLELHTVPTGGVLAVVRIPYIPA
jgi:two-component system LytT family sensor kinase